MAFCGDEKLWEICLCTCDDDHLGAQSEHVHCGCDECAGKAVSRATAFRHRARQFHVSSCSITSGATISLDSSDEQGTLQEQSGMELEASSGEDQHLVDQVMLDESEGFSDVHDSITREERELTDLYEDETVSIKVLNEKIVDSILDALELQLELKLSNIGFDHILDWGKKIFAMGFSEHIHMWPKCWKDAEQLLHSVGYRDAKKYMICLDESHRCHFGLMSSEDELCPHCNKKGTIPYYYLGLGPKLNLWTSDPIFCKKILAHWYEKDHWLGQENQESWGFECKKEIWDGRRFSELQWFWNPEEEWQLPAKCLNCGGVISVQEINSSPETPDGSQKLVTCPHCAVTGAQTVKKVHGDPRNLAYILHWDGFQPFDGKYNHGSGAIEIQIANMCKENRQKKSEIFVVGFVPAYLLPERRPISLDPFLSPFLDDIEDGFINGIEVEYKLSLPQFPAGQTILRHLVLCVTADHVAVCEICKAIFCGKNPCRRCKCGSTLDVNSNHYYYGEYRKSAKYPWPKRNLADEIETLKTIEDEERKTVAQEMAKKAGFTGLSILHRLHVLYGFDYRKHCVFDVMHMVSLGVIRNHLNFLLDNQLVNQHMLQERLSKVPWTAEFLASRYPSKLSRIGYWKAEDFQKFAFPISEVILGGLLSEEHFESWECLARIVEYLYCQGRNGWTIDSTAIFHKAVLRYNILIEECQGLRYCHVVNHNLTHISEDVLNFGSPDNFWCYSYERAVSRYVAISSNHKNIEITFARAELRREILKVRASLKGQEVSCEEVNTNPVKAHYRSLAELENAIEHSSYEKIHQSFPSGILLGALKPVHLSNEVHRNAITMHLTQHDSTVSDDISDVAHECRSIYIATTTGRMVYRVGENIAVSSEHEHDDIIHITQFLRVTVNSNHHIFVIGDCFQPVVHGVERVVDQWSKGTLLLPSGAERILPSSSIQRKVMLFPHPENLADPRKYILVDFQRPHFPLASVVVPCYPEVGDMLLIKGDDPEPWHGLVLAVNMRNKTVQVQFFMPHPRWGRRSGLWVREGTRPQQVHFKSMLGLCTGNWQGSNRIFKEL